MPVATLEELMEAGVHFGHKTNRWNPKMKPYIWGKRNGIYIIDLTQTTQLLENAFSAVKDAAARGKKIVFVGTKKQAIDIVAEEATRAGAYYINRRWLGGTLTNFDIIRTRINKMRELEEMRDNGHFERLPKKEVAVLNRQLAKLEKALGGLKEMRGMPDMLFVVDPAREANAVEEANKAGIPVVSLVDTNCDPKKATYVIPGNDDAIRSVRMITKLMADAILEGKAEREQRIAGKAAAPAKKAEEASKEEKVEEKELAGVAAASSEKEESAADA